MKCVDAEICRQRRNYPTIELLEELYNTSEILVGLTTASMLDL